MTDTMRWLIEEGIDVNHSNNMGYTAVHKAAHVGNFDALKVLKISGANIHAQSKDGSNAIMSASLGTGDCDIVRWLIEEGVDVNYSNKEGFTSVHYAAQEGNMDVLKQLETSGADIHAQTKDGWNSIISALLVTGDCNTVRWLIEQGVDVNYCSKEGFNAVHFATEKGNLDVLKLLNTSGAIQHSPAY